MQAGTTSNTWRPFCLISLILLVLFILSYFSEFFQIKPRNGRTEFHVINNTAQPFLLRGYSDTAILMPAGSMASFYDRSWLKKEPTLQEFIQKNMERPEKASLMGCSPILRPTYDWGMFTMPGESGWRKIFFARVDNGLNDHNRNNMNFLIHLFWILKVFFFIVLIESVLGLYYTRIRYKFILVILAVTLNFPVIYLSSDFGYWVQYLPDIFFTVPLWVLQPTSYFISFSIPVGTILLFTALLIRKKTIPVYLHANHA